MRNIEDNDKLFFRGLVASGKDKLDHSVYNDGDYNKWYYKMYFTLLDKIIFPDESYKIFMNTLISNLRKEMEYGLTMLIDEDITLGKKEFKFFIKCFF